MNKVSKESQQEKMFALVQEGQRSELSKKEFCQTQGIALWKYYYWQRRFDERLKQGKEEGRFIKVTTGKGRNAGIEIYYPNGVRLSLTGHTSTEELRRLIGLMR